MVPAIWGITHTTYIPMQVLNTVFAGRLLFCFAYITWPTPSPDLVVPDYFLWGYITSKVHETCLANIDDLKQHILECIQRFLRKWYSVLWQNFQRACRSVLNDMVVSYKVSYSNGNDSYEFSWTWSLLTNVNKIFPLALKCY